jgi:hypothetical protein
MLEQPTLRREFHISPGPEFKAVRRHRANPGLLAQLALVALIHPLSMHAQQISESALKAAFLYNFAKFVEWPPQSFASSSAPILLCTYQDSSVGSALQDIVSGKAIADRRLVVSQLRNLDAGRSCQILFVGAAARRNQQSIIAAFRGQSVLLVGDTEDFARDGGAINFIVRDDRLRFVVNLAAVDTSHLKLSSKLLSLAILTGR